MVLCDRASPISDHHGYSHGHGSLGSDICPPDPLADALVQPLPLLAKLVYEQSCKTTEILVVVYLERGASGCFYGHDPLFHLQLLKVESYVYAYGPYPYARTLINWLLVGQFLFCHNYFMKTPSIRIYNGANFCPDCDECPVVDYLPAQGLVEVSDPAKPGNGKFTMTVSEYNILLKNAKEILG